MEQCLIREDCAQHGGCRGKVQRHYVTMVTLNQYFDKEKGDSYSMALCDMAVELYKRKGAEVK